VSLIGLDVGTSALKVGVYREDGELIARARVPVQAAFPRQGWSELDAQDVWQAAQQGLARVSATPGVRQDPPIALAISASGDEVFPVDSSGVPLAPCILSGDTRGEAEELSTAQRATVLDWYERCGHVPERMDPINRILWWQNHKPEVVARTARFLGWHEYLTLCLCGEAVTDPSLAAKWAVYSLELQDWSPTWTEGLAIDPSWLPTIRPWGATIGQVSPLLAKRLDLPNGMVVAVGGFDASLAALGAGASTTGTVGLACGSWEVVTAPTATPSLSGDLQTSRFPVVPHPGTAAFAVLAQNPNGAGVIEWGARLLGRDISAVAGEVEAADPFPGPVLAVPHLSGALDPRYGGRDSRAAFLGMTLATEGSDLMKALFESVAFDLTLTLRELSRGGVELRALRATGGGTRSPWWMQLKADLTGLPVELVAQHEPGTFGAALLAGAAAGVYPTAGEASELMTEVERRFEPDELRREHYAARLDVYQDAVSVLMPTSGRLSRDLA